MTCLQSPYRRWLTAATTSILDLAGGDAGRVEELCRRVELLLTRVATQSCTFSEVNTSIVANAETALGVAAGGYLAIPHDVLLKYMPDEPDICPYDWTSQSERQAAPYLLERLKGWVQNKANPPVPNLFLDVQGRAVHSAMQVPVEGVANFSGMPDAIVPHRRIQLPEEAYPIAAAQLAVDWKRPQDFRNRRQVSAIGRIQALAFAQPTAYDDGKPVFFTDMSTGFRAWVVLRGTVYYLHPDRDLTLTEGVALIRYFLDGNSPDTAAAMLHDSHREANVQVRPAPLQGVSQLLPAAGNTASTSSSNAVAGISGTCDGRKQELRTVLSATTCPEDQHNTDLETVTMRIAAELLTQGYPAINLQW